ncbi:POLX protein, partial [Pseudoatta argentina]
MNTGGLVRIEALNKDNYDNWKMQMEALLVRNHAWQYVNGACPKPERIDGDAASETAERDWVERDSKAKSDLILSISAGELKQIKECQTLRHIWLKLESIYQSKGPARKATLLKRLMLQKMEEILRVKILEKSDARRNEAFSTLLKKR